ncbi:MAG: Ig-like domain-containing protein [bacterium]
MLIIFIASASSAQQPKNIKHSNITATQFFVSWITDGVGTGAIKYGTNSANLNLIAYDERGEEIPDDVHHIRAVGVTAETTYYYDILSDGITYNNAGQHYTITTGTESIPPTGDNPGFGTITKFGNPVQNRSCIVYLKLQEKNTNNISALQSMLVTHPEGIWVTYLNSFTKSDLSGEFKYTVNSNYQLIIFAEGANEGAAGMILDIKDPPLHQPAPDLEIGSDTTPPFIDDPKPVFNATQVNVNSNITLHLKDTGYGADVNTLVMKINNTTVTPTKIGTPQDYYIFYIPAQPFEFGTQVKVSIYARDLATSANTLDTFYTFTTTSDPNPPVITGRIPAPNATEVAVDTNITIFLQDMDSGIATSTIIMKVNGERVYPQISGTLPKYCTLVYDPAQDFKYSQLVNVSLEVADNSSNPLQSTYTFMTKLDNTPPQTSVHIPQKNDTNVPINILILFNIIDEDAGVASSTIVFRVNGATITTYLLNEIPQGYFLYYDPPVDFDYGQIIDLYLQVEDFATVPNKLIENYTFTITTDIIPPKVIYRKPDIRETQVPVETNITVYIRDDELGVDKNSIVLFVNEENVTGKLTITGTKTEYLVNYDPTVHFDYNQVVRVRINAKDLANNPMPQDAYTFTTKIDDIKPYVTDHFPAKGTQGVKVDTTIMFNLKDNESGVNISTMIFFVEGIDVTLEVKITGTKSAYNIFYKPKDNFYYGQVVDIMIKTFDFGSNTVEEIYSFTSEPDMIKPEISDQFPPKWATQTPKNTDIRFIISDNESGINPETIILKVNGLPIYINKTPITPPKAYLIASNLLNFGYNEVVEIYIEAGDNFGNIATETYTFTTIQDKKKPYTAEHYPAPAAIDVPVDTNIIVSVCDDESGVVRENILLKVNNSTITTMSVFPILNGFTLIYDPIKNFNYGEEVLIYIKVEDKAGNLATQTYTFTITKDITPPYTSDYNPTPFAADVPINTDVVLHIRDDGIGVDDSSIVMKVNDVRVFPIIIQPIQNLTLIYRPPVYFGFNEVVKINVIATDLAGNTMTPVFYTFTTTLDNLSPSMTDMIPAPNATQIAVDTNISLHIKDLGAGVKKDSILMKVNGQIVTPLISGTKEDYTIFYNPIYDFEANKRVYVYIYAVDLAQMPNVLEQEYFFTTIDTHPPYVTDQMPAPDSINAQPQTDVLFHIKDDGIGIDKTTIKVIINGATIPYPNYQIDGSITDFTFSYNPPVDFDYNQTVWVTIIARDFVGNSLNTTYKFFITDTIPPYTTDHKPEKGTTGVLIATEIEFHIKDIGAGVDKTSINLWINGNKVDALDITGNTYHYIVKHKPQIPFQIGQIVTITIEVKDLAVLPNTLYEVYTFTTKFDYDPPMLLWVVGKDNNHLIAFFDDENPPINIGNAMFLLFESRAPQKTIKVYSASLDGGKNVNLTTDILKNEVFYTLVVNNVTDAAGNPILPPNNHAEFSLKDTLEGIIEKTDNTKVEFSPNTFAENIATIEIYSLSEIATITQQANDNARQNKEIKGLVPNTTRVFIARKTNGAEALPDEFLASPEITIPYPPLVSNQEEKVFYRIYQLINNHWVIVPGKQEVDTFANTVSVKVPHFGIYRIAGSSPAPQLPADKLISQTEVFPNPFKPNHSFIYFRNFAGAITIRIFNIVGELMKTIEIPADVHQPYPWDVKDDDGKDLATGIYIYVITNSVGDKVTGKVSVIR